MDFKLSDRCRDFQERLWDFMEERIYPSESIYKEQLKASGDPHSQPQIIEELKIEARERGLWNMFHPDPEYGAGLTNCEYAPLAEIMGRSTIASEACNCSAPDTGNMEVLSLFGTDEQKKQWLLPLLDGKIRSSFAMTEPAVASSDATNIGLRIERDGDEYVLNGRKWWTSNAWHANTRIYIVMGKTDPDNSSRHSQQSMVLVPADAKGVKILRHLQVFGYDDAPHGHMEVELKDVRVPASNVLLGEGRGFEIAQGRLGPGRIHHCMRLIGQAERALERMCKRATERVAFGRAVAEQGVTRERIAQSRILIDSARFMCIWMLVASDEATAGSVMRNAERILPSSRGSSHCFFCSSVP